MESEYAFETYSPIDMFDENYDNSVGDTLRKQGMYSEALELYRNTLKEYPQKEYGRYTMEVFKVYVKMGMVYKAQEKYTEALDAYQKSITIAQSMDSQGRGWQFRSEHECSYRENWNFELSKVYIQMGMVYNAQERYAEALGVYQKSAEHATQAVHAFVTLAFYQNSQRLHEDEHSLCVNDKTKVDRIEIWFQNLYPYLNTKPSPHPHENMSLFKYFIQEGHNNKAQGKYTEALDMYQKSIDIARSWVHTSREYEHIEVQNVYFQMGQIYKAQEKYADALVVYEKSLSIIHMWSRDAYQYLKTRWIPDPSDTTHQHGAAVYTIDRYLEHAYTLIEDYVPAYLIH